MLKTFKTEIKPTRDQIIKIEKSIGVCRFLYNEYIRENIKSYEKDKQSKQIDTMYQSLWI